MDRKSFDIHKAVDEAFGTLDSLLERDRTTMSVRQVGTVVNVGSSIARVKGLPEVKSEELIRFPGDKLGIAFNLDPDGIDCYLLDDASGIRAGQEVRRTKRVMDVRFVPMVKGGD